VREHGSQGMEWEGGLRKMSQFQQIGGIAAQSRQVQRDIISLIKKRVHLLSGRDRLIMNMYLDDRITFGQMGRLLGVDPANVGRRVHRITQKLTGGEYIQCLKSRDRFTPDELAIARQHFLLGTSIRQIASDRSQSYYQTQQIVLRIKQLVHNPDRIN
jgi:hypothetical protein